MPTDDLPVQTADASTTTSPTRRCMPSSLTVSLGKTSACRPASRVGQVLAALVEGLDVATTGRVFGHRHATITAWLTRAEMHNAMLHDRWFDNLRLPHLQLKCGRDCGAAHRSSGAGSPSIR